MHTQIVWFKRDLRVDDHPALAQASAAGPVLAVYIVEPEFWRGADASGRHYAFLGECIDDLRLALAARGVVLLIRVGDAVQILRALVVAHAAAAVWSHAETGNAWTYARDRRVAAMLRILRLPWHEPRQFGVLRGLKLRQNWASRWHALMDAAPPATAIRLVGVDGGVSDPWPSARSLGLVDDPCPGRQFGGSTQAQGLLGSFVLRRGQNYQREMSSPLSAERACTRLSSHLAYGSVAMRTVYQRLRERQIELAELPPALRGNWPRALAACSARLHWHCHFIQKLESEPEIEFANVNAGYTGMREDVFDGDLYAAWAEGRTGWPFVDACMQCLIATGWINFRMRAMLMSISAFHYWLHWRQPALHLAQLFTDYEPGIHYSQAQMQAGVTGINVPRIYNPIKQSLDQDPDGVFIRRWLPHLDRVPTSHIHTPWLLSGSQQAAAGLRLGVDYPQPLREHETAARAAKAKLTAWRAGQAGLSALNVAVLRKHGSKKRNVRVVGKPATPPSPQGDLFGV